MKHRRLLQCLARLPTITETLEDTSCQGVSAHPSSSSSSSQSSQSSQSLDDYMTSIQALARPPGPVPCCYAGPVRLQRTSARCRLFSKPQMKHSASAASPRLGAPRAGRTSRGSALSLSSEELSLRLSLKMGRDRDCRGGDPMDWLFGQTQTPARTCGELGLKEAAL